MTVPIPPPPPPPPRPATPGGPGPSPPPPPPPPAKLPGGSAPPPPPPPPPPPASTSTSSKNTSISPLTIPASLSLSSTQPSVSSPLATLSPVRATRDESSEWESIDDADSDGSPRLESPARNLLPMPSTGADYTASPGISLGSPAVSPTSPVKEGSSSSTVPAITLNPSMALVKPKPQVTKQPFDPRDQTIYMVTVSRFADGDPSNNEYNAPALATEDPHWRGDLKGLSQRLLYIRDLGFTMICISPPTEAHGIVDYDGSCPFAWDRIDRRLESHDFKFSDLIQRVHELGMLIMQDVVVNHSSMYGIRGRVTNPTEIKLSRKTSSVTHSIHMSKLNPTWYHTGYGMIHSSTKDLSIGRLQGSHLGPDRPDLNTGSPVVQDYISRAIGGYLRLGVDAIRILYARFTDRDELLTGFASNWASVLTEGSPTLVAADVAVGPHVDLGLPVIHNDKHIYNFGKANAKGARWLESPAHYQEHKSMTVTDYNMRNALHYKIGELESFNGIIAELFEHDKVYRDPSLLLTFFQNSDVSWQLSKNGKEGGSALDLVSLEKKLRTIYTVLWLSRGIPMLFQGEEVMFRAGLPAKGTILDETKHAYYGKEIADEETQVKAKSHTIAKHIKRLNTIRAKYTAIRHGGTRGMKEVNKGKALQFIRELRSESKNERVFVGITLGSAYSFVLPSGVSRTVEPWSYCAVALEDTERPTTPRMFDKVSVASGMNVVSFPVAPG